MEASQSVLSSETRTTKPVPLILQGMRFEKIENQSFFDVIAKPKDFCIIVENETIDVHKSVLCAVSDYFRAMLESGMKEANEEVLHIQYTRADVVKTMIRYFYGEVTSIEWEHIKDYVDIVELWQLLEVKGMLETYIGENISPDNCIGILFMYADAYHMEHVKQKIIDLMNSQFSKISECKEFTSLSLSNLISLITYKGITHNNALLEGCIRWALIDECSRKHELDILINHICLPKCNPAYLKHILNTYGETLLTDQATQTKINEVISSSIILISRMHRYLDRTKMVFSVNITAHTVSQIGTSPYINQLPESDIAHGFTNSGIFCGGGWVSSNWKGTSNCSLFDLVTLEITSLPSFPKPTRYGSAVGMGNKVFMIEGNQRDCRSIQCLDLKDKQWTRCSPCKELLKKCVACVDSFIFVLSRNGRLLSYDTEKNSWNYRAYHSRERLIYTSAAVVNKDIHFVSRNLHLRYSTTEDKWSTFAKPPEGIQHLEDLKAICVKENLVLCGYYMNNLWLVTFDCTTDTWKTTGLKLSRMCIDFACTV